MCIWSQSLLTGNIFSIEHFLALSRSSYKFGLSLSLHLCVFYTLLATHCDTGSPNRRAQTDIMAWEYQALAQITVTLLFLLLVLRLCCLLLLRPLLLT